MLYSKRPIPCMKSHEIYCELKGASSYSVHLENSHSFGFKTYLVRRRTKTQKYKGAAFEQLESGWADHAQLKTKQNRKQGNEQGTGSKAR